MQPYANANQPQRAANAYNTSSYHGRSEAELMAALMSKLIKQLYLAQDCHIRGAFEAMNAHNAKTLHILDVLRQELLSSTAFNEPESKTAARFLLSVYSDTIMRLGVITFVPAPQDEYTALIQKLTPVYRAWLAVAPNSAGLPTTMHVATEGSTAQG